VPIEELVSIEKRFFDFEKFARRIDALSWKRQGENEIMHITLGERKYKILGECTCNMHVPIVRKTTKLLSLEKPSSTEIADIEAEFGYLQGDPEKRNVFGYFDFTTKKKIVLCNAEVLPVMHIFYYKSADGMGKGWEARQDDMLYGGFFPWPRNYSGIIPSEAFLA